MKVCRECRRVNPADIEVCKDCGSEDFEDLLVLFLDAEMPVELCLEEDNDSK